VRESAQRNASHIHRHPGASWRRLEDVFGNRCANKLRRTLGHNDLNEAIRVNEAARAGAREATGSTHTWRIETPVTDQLPMKAGANPAAFGTRADLVGVCATVDRAHIVVDVTVALPHDPDEPGEPVPASTAANKAVAGKRARYDVNHILTPGFHLAALERFGYFHPETIRLATKLGSTHASRQAPLMKDHIVAGAPDQNGLEARGASSLMANRLVTRMLVALQRSNAITTPARCQRERTGPFQVPPQVEETRFGVLASAGAEEGGAMPGDTGVAAA